MAAQHLTKHYNKPWQLLASVCLTRLNIVSQQLSGIEERYAVLLNELEHEQSVLNNYEYKKKELQDVTRKLSGKGKMTEAEEIQNVEASRQLAAMQDEEDMWTSDLSNVQLAPVHDTRSDCIETSVNRHLDRVLHFVVEDNALVNETTVLYPYDVINPDETLRQASDRILECHGINGNITYFSNAPVGVLKIRFDEQEERGQLYQGAKVIFVKAQSRERNYVEIEKQKHSHSKWLMLNELEQQSNVDYFKRIKKFVN